MSASMALHLSRLLSQSRSPLQVDIAFNGGRGYPIKNAPLLAVGTDGVVIDGGSAHEVCRHIPWFAVATLTVIRKD